MWSDIGILLFCALTEDPACFLFIGEPVLCFLLTQEPAPAVYFSQDPGREKPESGIESVLDSLRSSIFVIE